MREMEIRTPNLNLLFCKVIITESGELVLELKNGKRVERIRLEQFVSEINDFTRGCSTKLNIITE